MRPIAETPLHVDEIDTKGVRLIARPGMELTVERIGDELLSARMEALGIIVIGSSRQSLLDSLEEAIADVWYRYMLTAPDEPDDEVAQMRQRLRSRFRPY